MFSSAPKQIGRYKIQEELGSGACGRVYRALDPRVDRLVAVKVLNVDDPHLLARFRREAAATASLHHQNIVTIYEYGDHKGMPFIAMEYLEGEDLQHVIADHRPLTLLQKVRIMHQVAEGLHSAHQSGVVHRDIKPANIMVLPDGTVKIMDFGIARIAGGERAGATLTAQGDLLGTVMYMSPEQFRDPKDVDVRSDIFAYGVVYYELLAGRHPFEGSDVGDVMLKIAREEPPSIRGLAPDCPTTLEYVLRQALRKERELRYLSLADLQVDVAPVLVELQHARAVSLVMKAKRAFTSGEMERARDMVREVLRLEPTNAEGRRLWEAVEQEIRRKEVRPQVEVLIRSAAQQLAEDRVAKAIELLEAALRLDSKNTAVQTRLLELRARLEQQRPSHQSRLKPVGTPARAAPAVTPPSPPPSKTPAPAVTPPLPVAPTPTRTRAPSVTPPPAAEVRQRKTAAQRPKTVAKRATEAVKPRPRTEHVPARRRTATGPVRRPEDYFREKALRTALQDARTLFSERKFSDAEKVLKNLLALKPQDTVALTLLRATSVEQAIEQERQAYQRDLEARQRSQRVGDYRILSKLGAGEMGTVYRALDTRRKRPVVLRVLPGAAARQGWQEQARAAGALTHPNTARILDVGEVNGSRFIAAEYVEGQTLDDHVSAHPPQPAETAAWALQVARSLEEAHIRGIVHGNIKPRNILITSGGRVKVLDFGLGDPAARPAADLQALGHVLLETAEALPPDLARIVRRCLAKPPQKPYSSATELVADLRVAAPSKYKT